MTATHFAINLASAFVFGAIIGVERQWRQRMAGLRTNTLVAVGAALFVLLAEMVTGTDATLRVAAQVVSGIGFLGAGVIMREGLSVRGLNTAATLWCSAAVGTLAGAGYLREAMMGTLAVLVANTILRPIGLKIDRRPADQGEANDVTYVLRLGCRSDSESHVRALLLHAVQPTPLALRSLHSEDVEPTGRTEVRATLLSAGRQDTLLEEIVARLSIAPDISSISWEVVANEEH